MKTLYLLFLLFVFLTGSKVCAAQYGGYTANGATNHIEAGCTGSVFSDITYNDGAITSNSTASVYFIGSAPNTQHQIVGNVGGALFTQIGNVILNNGTGGLLINNTSTGLEILGNFNFNGQNAKVTTLRNATTVANNNLHIGANATITGFNAANNINGYVKKDGDATGFTFPLAYGAYYAPMVVGALGAGNSVTGAYYNASGNTAAAFEGGPFPVTSFISSLLNVSPLEYWDINNTGTPSAAITLTFQGNYSASTISTLSIVGWSIANNQWELIPSGIATGLTPGNSISSLGSVNFPDYSALTIATLIYPLPLTLVDFTASKSNNNQVVLFWKTTNESNLRNFIVERSDDKAGGWIQVGKLPAVNSLTGSKYNLVDYSPREGNNYYRLKIVDADGSATYSFVRLVTCYKAAFNIRIYPNPVLGIVNISVNGNTNDRYSVFIMDITSRVLQQRIDMASGKEYRFDLHTYSKGIYYVNLFDRNNKLMETRKIIKN
jgi:hypothetical protein